MLAEVESQILVVVIEADSQFGLRCEASLRGAGHLVVLATDGHSGLEAVVERSPDLVLIGSGLAPLDGLAVLAVLRAGPGTSRVAAVLITSGNDPELRERAFKLGADEVVPRRFLTPAVMARRVPHWLLARSRQQASRRRLMAVPSSRAPA